MKCHRCNTEKAAKAGKGGEKLPFGWRRLAGGVWCDNCRKACWTVRAVALPILAAEGMEWPALESLLNDVWRRSTRLANWAMTTAYLADKPPSSVDTGLAKAPKLYLYGELRSYSDRAEWDGLTQSASCLLHAVEQKYLSSRREILWGKGSLPSFRFPFPFPVHNASWTPAFGPDRRPKVTVALPGGRVTLALRVGPELRRQVRAFAELVADPDRRGELSVYRRGGPGKRRFMVKIVGYFRKEEARTVARTLLVRTDPAALWVAEVVGDGGAEGRAPWKLNADHVRRWVARHKAYLRRIAEDTKHEKRWSRDVRRNIDKSRAIRCAKQHDRLGTWNHTATKMLADFAARQRVDAVIYDDQDRSYIPEGYDWSDLQTKLLDKLARLGIALVAPGEPADESAA
jgi:hypothetical protein